MTNPVRLEDQVARVIEVLGLVRADLTDEKRTQADLAAVLHACAVPFAREVRLAAGDVVDFVAFDRIAVEVKRRRARPSLTLKQLLRYAAHPSIAAVVLVTNRSMGLPPSLAGKPAYYVSLGRAWL